MTRDPSNRNSPRRFIFTLAAMCCTSAIGCGGADAEPEQEDDSSQAQEPYEFSSRFDGEDSVSYSGQTFRHVLIHDVTDSIGGLTARIDAAGYSPMEGEVLASLEALYDFDDYGDLVDATTTHGVASDPAPLQQAYGDIGSGKNLSGKIAGADDDGHQHADWSSEMAGWGEQGSVSPDALVREWFGELDALAVARAHGDIPLDPQGNPIAEVYVTEDGQDLKQLTQKFLLGAVAFSQGTDDYLDEGLASDNLDPKKDGANYTALEHAWDEAFGYFGATRDYADYTDEEIAGNGGRSDYANGCHDTNADGAIDLTSEMNFGHATNAAKRDLGSHADAPTDMTGAAYAAFWQGRRLIADAEGELDATQLAELEGYRTVIVENWEAAIAATAVHYINDILQDMGEIGSHEYDFLNHAKHWSELKGFALSFQFNPRSPLAPADFVELHQLIGDAPAVEGDLDAARADLLEARALLGAAYGFDEVNLGDADGEGGW
jgi:hypothetical protein